MRGWSTGHLHSARVTAQWRGRPRVFPYAPCAHTCTGSPLSTFPRREGHLIRWMNLHSHIIITQSPQLTLGLTPCGAHFMGLDKHIMTRTFHYSNTQRTFTVLKIPCALPIHPFFSPKLLETTNLFIFKNKNLGK